MYNFNKQKRPVKSERYAKSLSIRRTIRQDGATYVGEVGWIELFYTSIFLLYHT